MTRNEMDFGYDRLMSGSSDHIRVNEFTEHACIKFHDQVTRRAMMDPMGPIIIYIDSFGGSVDGVASMIETLNSVQNKIITVCIGKAMSAGAILLAAGDYRFCGKNSRIMLHAISSGAIGDAYDVAVSAEEIMRLNTHWLDFLAKKCGMDGYADFKKILDAQDGRELYFNAEAAKEFGIVDEIGLPFVKPLVMYQVDALPPKDQTPISEMSLDAMMQDQALDIESIVDEVLAEKPKKKKVTKKAVKKAVKKVAKKKTKK